MMLIRIKHPEIYGDFGGHAAPKRWGQEFIRSRSADIAS
jgi:hypothetical protein